MVERVGFEPTVELPPTPHFERGIVSGLTVRPNYTNGCGKILGKDMAKVGFCHMLLRLRHVGFAPPKLSFAVS